MALRVATSQPEQRTGQAGNDDQAKVKVLERELAAVCDEMIEASQQVSNIESEARAKNFELARLYADLAASRRIYWDTLKSNEEYVKAKASSHEVMERYQDLLKRPII